MISWRLTEAQILHQSDACPLFHLCPHTLRPNTIQRFLGLEARGWRRGKKTMTIIIKPRTIQALLLKKGKWSQSGLHARLNPITVWLGFTQRLGFCFLFLYREEICRLEQSLCPTFHHSGNQQQLGVVTMWKISKWIISNGFPQIHEVHHVAEDCNLTLNTDAQLNVKQVRGGATSCRAGNNHRFTPSLYFIVLTFFSSPPAIPPSPSLPSTHYFHCKLQR